MQINTSYNYTNPAFSGYYTKEAKYASRGKLPEDVRLIIESANNILSNKSKKLFSALNMKIEESWEAIKKGESTMKEPVFYLSNKGRTISVKPIYGADKPLILMDVDNGKYTERILFDRKNPRNFRYEKVVPTDYGSATVKSFNSETQQDNFVALSVNEMVERYFPKIISKEIINSYFGRFYEI